MKFDNSRFPQNPSSIPSNYDIRREAWLSAYAETSCQIVEKLSGLLANEKVTEGSPEYFGIINTIYIVYGRPFHRCAGVGRLEKSDIPIERHDVHDHLMTFRDKVYGHKDIDGIRIDEDYNTNEVRVAVDKDGQMRIFCTELYTRPPKMPEIQEHASLLQSHFGQRMKEIHAQLLPGGKLPNGEYLYDGEFILSVDWREDAAFKRIPDHDAYVYRTT